MATYKLKNGQQTGFVPGVGAIVDGKITTNQKLEGANFELVSEPTSAQPTAPVAPVALPTSPQSVQAAPATPSESQTQSTPTEVK